jgi:hypothetical protein
VHTLQDLENLIDMYNLKNKVAQQIKLIIHTRGDNKGHYWNTLIHGKPGCDKSLVSLKIAHIWNALGLFNKKQGDENNEQVAKKSIGGGEDKQTISNPSLFKPITIVYSSYSLPFNFKNVTFENKV